MLSGFTVDRQTDLDVLWDKLKRSQFLSDRDWELANTLAQQENEYLKTLKTAAANAGISLTGSESTEEILWLIGETASEAI